MTDELKDFCRNYEVNVLNDQKRRARYHPPSFLQIPIVLILFAMTL
jgi:hypothetical protein